MGGVGLGDERKFEVVGSLNVGGIVFLISDEEGSSIECGLASTPIIFPELMTGKYLFLIFTQLFLQGNGLNLFHKHTIILHPNSGRLLFSVLLSF